MKNVLLVPELRELLAEGNAESLREFCGATHPAFIAEFLSGLTTEEIHQILSYADRRARAEIFSYLDSEIQLALASSLQRPELVELISNMSHDERVDLIKRMPEAETQIIMPAIAQVEREDIRKLASYPEGTAGAVMTSDYATLSPDLTVEEAIRKLRLEAPDKETIYYAYVVDDQRRLIGFVSLKDLILARSFKRVGEVMHSDVISARLDEDQEEVARKIEKYDLLAIPIINGGGALVGIVTHDDAMDIIREEQTEDIEKFMGLTGEVQDENYLAVPATAHFRRRAFWAVTLALLGLISGAVLEMFEDTLTSVFILAFYLPMLIGTGGNTGSQAATVVVRALALRQIRPGNIFEVVWKELRVSLMLSMALILVALIRVFLFSPAPGPTTGGFSLIEISTVVALALGLQVISATLIGALLPILASKAKIDPAVVASPALATSVDITGMLIYFGLAKLMLGI
ncbi:MAG: magnesium transporter [Candidatus Abyssobacteria bacterium SURF_5]|uniref:Magnesium transporter MgtE n=1 Tax=Abyssobacteria bacterium (strain SURF_5) TaxID=2093360 RepID=A0A3A4P6F1_ABYX5|nr:MAG: magnesium transporter [Candidatus Abyssubacteria bacterium SURF_5]